MFLSHSIGQLLLNPGKKLIIIFLISILMILS